MSASSISLARRTLTEFAHEVGVAKPQHVHAVDVLPRWLIKEGVLNRQDTVDLFGDEDPDEEGVSFIGRVQTDEAVAEQGMATGTRRRAPWEAA